MRTYEQWIKKSYRLPGISENPWLAVDFQALGRLDVIIKNAWDAIKDKDIHSDREILIQNDIFILSRLWVLSGFEIVRILKEKDPDKYRDLYKLFRSVRIPLAKYEKPGKKGSFSIAQLGWESNTRSIGWNVGQDKFVTQDILANELLGNVPG